MGAWWDDSFLVELLTFLVDAEGFLTGASTSTVLGLDDVVLVVEGLVLEDETVGFVLDDDVVGLVLEDEADGFVLELLLTLTLGVEAVVCQCLVGSG